MRNVIRGTYKRKLQEAVRIDIHLQPQIPRELDLGEPGADQGLGGDVAAAFQQEAPAVAPAEQGQGGGRGAEDQDAGARRRGAGELAGDAVDSVGIGAGEDEGGEAAEGRHAGGPALRHLMGDEAVAVVGDQGPDHGILRIEGLEQHLAGALGAPGPARHLMQELKGPLGARADRRR